MTKHTKPLDIGHKPVHEAAAAIVALINASRRSPREEEIANIIAKAMPATLGGDYAIARRWEAAEAAHYAVAIRNGEASGGGARVSQRRADQGDAADVEGARSGLA